MDEYIIKSYKVFGKIYQFFLDIHPWLAEPLHLVISLPAIVRQYHKCLISKTLSVIFNGRVPDAQWLVGRLVPLFVFF
jgi:hypothetical protein